jgi:hypothetical protein
MFTFSHGKYNCLGKNISKIEIYEVILTLIKNFIVSNIAITESFEGTKNEYFWLRLPDPS